MADWNKKQHDALHDVMELINSRRMTRDERFFFICMLVKIFAKEESDYHGEFELELLDRLYLIGTITRLLNANVHFEDNDNQVGIVDDANEDD